MPERFSKAERSAVMAAVKSRDTGAEKIVRKLLHRMGYRYRLHRADLPGRPDLVFPRRRKVIFIHGCFWHLHSCRKGQLAPKNNAEYWERKRTRNRARDRRTLRSLRSAGWSVMVVWECQLKSPVALSSRLQKFLDGAGSAPGGSIASARSWAG